VSALSIAFAILGDFLPQFQSFHIEMLKSILGVSNDLGFQNYFNTGDFY